MGNKRKRFSRAKRKRLQKRWKMDAKVVEQQAEDDDRDLPDGVDHTDQHLGDDER